MSRTISIVEMAVSNNVTWDDAFQFGTVGDTSWDFTGKTFSMDLKERAGDPTPIMTLSTTNGRIVVDDAVARILHFVVTPTDLQAISARRYVYDLIMTTTLTGQRDRLMLGSVKLDEGPTKD